jgi:hypothetical protein
MDLSGGLKNYNFRNIQGGIPSPGRKTPVYQNKSNYFGVV